MEINHIQAAFLTPGEVTFENFVARVSCCGFCWVYKAGGEAGEAKDGAKGLLLAATTLFSTTASAGQVYDSVNAFVLV